MEGETESLPCCGDIPTPNVPLSSTEIALLQLSEIWGGFYPVHRAHHGGFPCLGTSSKKKPKPKQKGAYNQHAHKTGLCSFVLRFL